MFAKKAREKTELDKAIDDALAKLDDPTTDDYAKITKQLTKLYAMKEAEKPTPRVNSDTLLMVAGNLAGILVIVGYEHAHVITSKAQSYIRPNRGT